MRDGVERGSGSLVSVSAIAGISALAFGLLAGVAVIRQSIEALRTAESAAITLATLSAEGEAEPCRRAKAPIVECSADGDTVTVRVELRGFRASATAGPDPRD